MNWLNSKWFVRPLLYSLSVLLLLMLGPGWLDLKPAYVWTDKLVFLLLIMITFFIAYLRTQPHLLRPWKKVFTNKRAMGSTVVLLFFVIIGLLDSVHFTRPLPSKEGQKVYYETTAVSLLDVLAAPLKESNERTFSAPLAAYALAKESVTTKDGRTMRIFPRLKHGGAHLKDPEKELAGDVVEKILLGLLWGAFVWAVLSALFVRLYASRHRQGFMEAFTVIRKGHAAMPWHVALWTLLALSLVMSVLVVLGLSYHVLGTDKVGQDVFYQTLKSIRTGLVIGTLTTLVMLPFAVFLGIAAGYFRGWVDDVIQYLYTTLSSIPSVLLIAAAILSIQVYIANHPQLFNTVTEKADLRLLALCVILGITSWTGLCRLLRGESLKLREMDYIQAATAFGVSSGSIIRKHIMPNVMHIVLIVVVLDFSGLVLAEAVLSYVGVGVDPSTISWGNMINNARLEMGREPMVWWTLVAAFTFMFVLVLAANLFSDAVRDAFDPRIRDGEQ